MSNDLISRKAAIEQCKRHDDYTAWSIMDGIEALPSVEAEPKRGRWNEGAIISGYQGIGKSTLAKNGSGYIDLESGNFFVNGERSADWYIAYSQIAIHLAEQGYRVFISSHAVVREYLASLPKTVDLFVCFPSYSLKKAWVKKLEMRFQSSGLDKDYRAWQNAVARYDENIKELHETAGFVPIVIHDMDYSLERLLDTHAVQRWIWRYQNDLQV